MAHQYFPSLKSARRAFDCVSDLVSESSPFLPLWTWTPLSCGPSPVICQSTQERTVFSSLIISTKVLEFCFELSLNFVKLTCCIHLTFLKCCSYVSKPTTVSATTGKVTLPSHSKSLNDWYNWIRYCTCYCHQSCYCNQSCYCHRSCSCHFLVAVHVIVVVIVIAHSHQTPGNWSLRTLRRLVFILPHDLQGTQSISTLCTTAGLLLVVVVVFIV